MPSSYCDIWLNLFWKMIILHVSSLFTSWNWAWCCWFFKLRCSIYGNKFFNVSLGNNVCCYKFLYTWFPFLASFISFRGWWDNILTILFFTNNFFIREVFYFFYYYVFDCSDRVDFVKSDCGMVLCFFWYLKSKL